MRITLLIALTLWLAACGQKGALYMPVEGAPPPGADQSSCETCPVIKVPATNTTGSGQGQKIILEPQPQVADTPDKDKEKDKTSDTDTSTTDSTQETTQ